MAYWTVKENNNVTIIQTNFDDVLIDVGRIEKPYRNDEYYFATGWNHEMLGNNGSYIFRSYEEAEKRIITHYENEMSVLNK